MKKCPTCQEEFANEFSYCPVDATPLNNLRASVAPPAATVDANERTEASVIKAPAANSAASVTRPAMPTSGGVQASNNIAKASDAPAPPSTTLNYQQQSSASQSFTSTANGRPDHVAANGAEANIASPKANDAGNPAPRGPEREEYHLTILEDTGIARRLGREVSAVAQQSQLTWPEFKRDPSGFVARSATGYGRLGYKFITSPNVAIALTLALLMVFGFIGFIIAYDRLHKNDKQVADAINPNLEFQGLVTDIPEEQKKPDPGNAGNNKGNGGGSKEKLEKPAGGGGGGREETKPASAGKLPPAVLEPQIVAPDPRPPTIKNPSLPVPATINADSKLFPTDNRAIPYGDPKSKSTEISSGPGTGNGIGNGTGGGVGPGEGGGVGPGRGGNAGGGDMRAGGGGPSGGGGGTLTAKEVTTKAQITSKPEPSYTEEARKNNVTGTVILRAVLAANGHVSNVVPVQRLPYGLTEKAIAAAQMIRFTPATKDGRPVGMYVRIEYNFNMY